jgi:hypothetical protein
MSDEFVDILLTALSCSISRSTTERLIGDVRVSVLKMFHPPSDTADTHTDISIHSTKSLVDDCCRVSLFHKKFNDSMLTKRHVFDSHFPAGHDGNVRGDFPFMLEREYAASDPKISLRYSCKVLHNLTVLISFGTLPVARMVQMLF